VPLTNNSPAVVSGGAAEEAAKKIVPEQKVRPQRIKPNSTNNAVTAAMNRGNTQNQLQHRLFQQPGKPFPTANH
jgi:hypothetical protein